MSRSACSAPRRGKRSSACRCRWSSGQSPFPQPRSQGGYRLAFMVEGGKFSRIDVRAPFTTDEVARGALRAELVVIAIVFAATGVAVLTSAAAIPFTVVLWLCAATSLGFAAFGPFAPRP